MNDTRTVDAVLEPVTLQEAKAHLVVEHDDDDAQIADLIRSARQAAETQTGRALIEQTWVHTRVRFSTVLVLARVPVLSVTTVGYLDSEGNPQVVPSSDYDLVPGEPAVIAPAMGKDWPSTYGGHQDITVTYKVGYGAAAADVPAPIRQAILMLITDFYEFRASIVTGTNVARVPTAAMSLLKPYRAVLFP